MNAPQKMSIALLGSVVIAGCSSGSSSSNAVLSDTVETFDSANIDASSYTDYTYFNLETGQVVALTEAEAAASTNWHVGFRRNAIILNGGTSGSGSVEGALGAAQDDFYAADEPVNNVFLNASADAEDDHLLATYDVSTLTFTEDAHQASILGSGAFIPPDTIDGGWYLYNTTTHAITVNDANWWFVRSNLGTSYAKFNATALTYDRVTGLDVTLSFDVQADGTNQFATTATFNASVPSAGGEDCFDFDANTAVACSSADWDVKVEIAGRNFNIWTNGGVSGDGDGAAFGPVDAADAALYTSATIAPGSGTDISRHYTADANASVFTENAWYAYNLEGNHKLWPNYRTYLIDLDSNDNTSAVYKLQVTSYYNEIGLSGHPSIRYEAN